MTASDPQPPEPDRAAAAAALARQATLTKPPGSLGRLEDLGVWLAATTGTCPPRPLTDVRVVVFAGDHGIATAAGTSAYPSSVTAQMVANFLTGGAAVNVLARAAGAEVQVVDVAVDSDYAGLPVPPAVAARRVLRGSRPLDRQDALTPAEVQAAFALGRAVADDAVDSGADLLIPGDMGIGSTTACAALVAIMTGADVAAVVGRGTGIDDDAWMRKTAAVRDACFRARHDPPDPELALQRAGGAEIAAMAAFLARAAQRGTPVLLDGVVSCTAALLAEARWPGSKAWWQAAHRSTEPAQHRALDQLDLVPLLDLGLRLGEGTGALAALPLLRAAAAVLGQMATFEQAGVDGADVAAAAGPAGAGA
jgi:nicotinate-nucleotide--dimethylbenzimidazole phosphoribosyltransferase